jgi:hypothetical protein
MNIIKKLKSLCNPPEVMQQDIKPRTYSFRWAKPDDKMVFKWDLNTSQVVVGEPVSEREQCALYLEAQAELHRQGKVSKTGPAEDLAMQWAEDIRQGHHLKEKP